MILSLLVRIPIAQMFLSVRARPGCARRPTPGRPPRLRGTVGFRRSLLRRLPPPACRWGSAQLDSALDISPLLLPCPQRRPLLSRCSDSKNSDKGHKSLSGDDLVVGMQGKPRPHKHHRAESRHLLQDAYEWVHPKLEFVCGWRTVSTNHG